MTPLPTSQRNRTVEERRPSAPRGPLAAGAALCVTAWCLVWTPLLGDQALMALVGQDVVHGRHLYTEIFDAKQPGMYFWYGLSRTATYPALGQALCILVVIVTAILLTRLLADRLSPRLRSWAPVVAAAPLLLSLSPYDMGQTELLMNLPATAAVLLAARRTTSVRADLVRDAAAGLCLGVIVVFKTLLVVVPGLGVLVLLLLSGRRRWARIATVALGSVVAPLAVVAWLALRGDLAAALDTWFVYPEQVLAGASVRDTDRLVAAVSRFAVLMAPLLLLAAWRLPTVLRRRDPLDLALTAWLAAGLLSYAVQVWWSYYLLILLPPLIGLAALQLDEVVGRFPVRRVVLAGLAVLALPLVAYGTRTTVLGLADGGGLTEASRARTAERIGHHDTISGQIAGAGLRADDSLFVLGDPRYQLISGRPIPITTNGWSAAVLPPQRWALMARELEAARPDMILVGTESAEALAQRGGSVRAVLSAQYSEVRHGDEGVWYRLDPEVGT